MKNSIEKPDKYIYAIVLDNHGDLQRIPKVDGKFYIPEGYSLQEFVVLPPDKFEDEIQLKKSEDT